MANNMLRQIACVVGLIFIAAGCAANHSDREIAGGMAALRSPDGHLSASISTSPGLSYSASLDNQPILARSQLGLAIHGQPAFGPGAKMISLHRESFNRTWE